MYEKVGSKAAPASEPTVAARMMSRICAAYCATSGPASAGTRTSRPAASEIEPSIGA